MVIGDWRLMDKTELISLGYLKRTHNRDLPKFIFVQRDGLFVPFRSEEIASLMGEEIWVKRSDIQEEDDGLMTWQDLVGYTIMDDEAGAVGTPAEVFRVRSRASSAPNSSRRGVFIMTIS